MVYDWTGLGPDWSGARLDWSGLVVYESGLGTALIPRLRTGSRTTRDRVRSLMFSTRGVSRMPKVRHRCPSVPSPGNINSRPLLVLCQSRIERFQWTRHRLPG